MFYVLFNVIAFLYLLPSSAHYRSLILPSEDVSPHGRLDFAALHRPKWSLGPFYFTNVQVAFKRVKIQPQLTHPVIKSTKHGTTTLAFPGRLFLTDLTIYMDIHSNPGPDTTENNLRNSLATVPDSDSNSHASDRISYSRHQLLGWRSKYATLIAFSTT